MCPPSTPSLASTALAQNIWSTVYVDALAARDRDSDNSTSTPGQGRTADGTAPASGLEERVYLQHDANFNVTSLVRDSDDSVVERYAYLPYGQAEVLTATWSAQPFTAYANPYRFQGLRLDPATGLHHARFRDYADWLGRWTQQDPAVWPDGVGRGEFVGGNPLSSVDPTGLESMGSTDPNAWNFNPYLASKNQEKNQPKRKPNITWRDRFVFGAVKAKYFQTRMEEKYGTETNLGEAARHVYWMAYVTYHLHRGIAEKMGNAHEHGNSSPDSRRDMRNNDFGTLVGDIIKLSGSDLTDDEFAALVERYLLTGGAWGKDADGNVVPFTPKLPKR